MMLTNQVAQFLRCAFVALSLTATAALTWAAPAAQTIRWRSPATNAVLQLYEAYPLVATASSHLPVTFRVQTGPAFIADGTITATNVGTIVLVAEQVGDSAWASTNSPRNLNQADIALRELWNWPVQKNLGAIGLAVSGSLAYVGTMTSGLQILDLSNPTSPVQLGTFGFKQPVNEIQVVGSVAYLAASGNGLQILDVSDPAKPTKLGEFTTSNGFTQGIHIVGTTAYIADLASGLHILDVSIPATPSRLGTLSGSIIAGSVKVVGNLAYVSVWRSNSLLIVDVSTPSNPVLLGSSVLGAPPGDIQVVNGLAYLALESYGLRVLDVSNPAEPTVIARPNGSGLGTDIQMVGHLAFVTGYELDVFDVSNPRRPSRVGRFAPGNVSWGIQVSGSTVYLAGSGFGVKALEWQSKNLPQGIRFAPPTLVSTTNPLVTLSAEASSGLPVNLTVVEGPATIAGNQLTSTGPGLVLVRADQAGNDIFRPASVERRIRFIAPGQPLATTPTLTVGEDFSFRVQAEAEQRFVVLVSEDLLQWRELSEFVGTTEPVVVKDSGPDSVRRYYQVVPR